MGLIVMDRSLRPTVDYSKCLCYPRTQGVSSPIAGWGGHRLGNTQIMCYTRTQGVSSPIAGWGGAQVREYTDYVLPQNTGSVQPHSRVGGGGGTGWGIHRLCATPEHRECPAP